MTVYDIGETVRMTVYVRDTTGALVDAGAVPTWTVTDPTGAVTHPTGAKTATGTYVAVVAGSVAGRWVWSTSATGGGLGTDTQVFEDAFDVAAAEEVGLISVTALREYLGNVPATDDEKLREIILEVSEICEDVTGKTWRKKTITGETHDGGRRVVRLKHTPASSSAVTSVTENGVAVTSAGWFVDVDTQWLCRGSTTSPMAWAQGVQNIVVSYTAGPAGMVIPRTVMRGVKELCRDFWSVQRGGRNNRDQDMALDPRSGHLLPLPVLQAWQLKREYPVG